MKQRIITAIILGIAAIPICIFSNTVLFPIVMAFIGVAGVYELLGCMNTRGKTAVSLPLYIIAGAAPFAVRYFGDVIFASTNKLLFAVLIFSLYILAVWVFSYQRDQKTDMNSVLASVFVSLYIIGATASIVLVRDARGGEYYWYFIFVGAWVTDIFAYFTGMMFGKHKLIEAVSPKKTVEGSIGGTLFCVGFFVLLGFVANKIFDLSASLLVYAFAGLLSALASQIGDLSMSVIKRTYGVKDYGKIFPGHGGVLDRFDSILAVAIVLALLFA